MSFTQPVQRRSSTKLRSNRLDYSFVVIAVRILKGKRSSASIAHILRWRGQWGTAAMGRTSFSQIGSWPRSVRGRNSSAS